MGAMTMARIKYSVIVLIIISLLFGPLSSRTPVHAKIQPELQQATSDTQIIYVPGQVGDLQSAIYQISDGGIIELSAGTYNPPSNGWHFNNLQKGFTIRAAAGATVTLNGQGTRDIFRMQNSSVSNGGPVTFEGIVFANGYTTTEGTAAGVTLYNAEATFVNCVFRDNNARVNTTVGGAVYVADHSTVFFIDTVWMNNTSICGGSGLGIRSDSTVYIHNTQFINNHAITNNHTGLPGGAAINAGNSELNISNTRFEGNESAGWGGGALYAIGNWQAPWSTPRMKVILSNTTFINNKIVRDPSDTPFVYTEGGAVHVEDQTLLKVHTPKRK